MHEVRLCSAQQVDFALNAAAPACGVILEALQADTADVESIGMRRAGSSVMVSLRLRPLGIPGPSSPDRPGGLPDPTVPNPRGDGRGTGVLEPAGAAR